MAIYVFTNNVNTTLQTTISNSATALSVAIGTGSEFPTLGMNEVFAITVLDAATQTTNEIMLCTEISGDNLTVVRAQEGTTALEWAAGSIISLLLTAGATNSFLQPDEVQTGTYNYAVAEGTVNAITVSLPSSLTDISDVPDGFSCNVSATGANTGATYLTLTLGSTVLPTHEIVKNDQVTLIAGDIPAQFYPIELVYSAAWGKFVMDNPTYAVSGSISGGLSNELIYQTAASTTGFIPAPSVENSFLGYTDGVINWEALPTVTLANNLAGGSAYEIPYQTASNTTSFMGSPTVAGSLLSYTGSGFAWTTTGLTANVLQTTNFKVFETGGKLYFQYQGTNIASLSSSGVFTALSSLIGAGTP